MTLDVNGNIYLGGGFIGTCDFDPGPGTFNMTAYAGPSYNTDAYIMKVDNNGNFLWAKSYSGEFGESVTSMDMDGTHVYVTGNYGGSAMDFDPGPAETILSGSAMYVSKFDLDGNFVWARSMGGHNLMLPYLTLDAGNVYTTVSFATAISGPVDFDPGAGQHLLTSGVWDVALTKLTKAGNFVWAVSVGSPDEFETESRPVIDPAGNLYVSGRFKKTADFDPSACIYNITSYGDADVFNLKLSQQASIAAPTITSFSPGTGPIGTTVIITGTNFSSSPASNTVKFANNRTATVTASTTTSLTVTVPASAITGKITVTVNCSTATSASDFVVGAAVALPTITSFTPSSGPVGKTVTITGTNFSSTPANNTVRFNGTTATVSASTATSITTTVPAGATTGKITVTVGGNMATSASSFTVTAAPTISFTTQPEDRSVCAGTNTTISVVASGDTNLQYRWQINDADFTDLANNSTYSGVATATLTITNATADMDGTEYRCVVHGDNSTDSPSAAAELTVQAAPDAPSIDDYVLGCAPASTTLVPTGALDGETYRYHDAPTGGNLLGSGMSFATPSLSTSTTYHISVFNTTTLCESTRTPALVTVEACNAPVVLDVTSAAYIEGIVTVDLSTLISDPDNNLDIGTLKIAAQPQSGATATLDEFILTVDYTSLPFPGTDIVTMEVCDLTKICTQQEVTIEITGDVEVYNAISPNADGKNDTFVLQYIDLFADTQNNKVTIFNRWGDVVSEIKNYNNKDRVFKGLNKNGNEIPSGTYYYRIEFDGSRKARTGYLVLNR
jgi:gliding motility-associated-like protein